MVRCRFFFYIILTKCFKLFFFSLLIFQIKGLHWRHPDDIKPHAQLVDPLRHIMQRKLSKLGTLYHYMFVMPEMNKGAIDTPQ